MSDIPQFSTQRQWETIAPEVEAAVARVLRSGRYVLGPENEAFEEAIRIVTGTRYAFTCGNGTEALHLALRAVGVRAGDIVLTTPFTFFATVGAILLSGAQPELVDIDPVSLTIDPEALGRALRQPRATRVGAIVPVHLYGRMAAMPAIRELARQRDIPVVEDGAQALGAHLEGRPAGSWGTAAAFSFYPTKNLGAMGEGGLVTTDDAEVAAQVRLLRVHGSRERYIHLLAGWNARLDELQAAILAAKLPHLSAWNQRRQEIAAQYEVALLATGLARLPHPGPALAPILLPLRTTGHVFHQYVLRAQERDGLRRHLQMAGIGSEVYYPVPVHHQPVFAGQPLAQTCHPEAERAAQQVLALPMFPELTDGEIERVVSAIAEFYAATRGGAVSGTGARPDSESTASR
ncbi:MAG: DegT/DnrJ/EryC1/StrS family aminotransferase [Terriglobales bacterium]